MLCIVAALSCVVHAGLFLPIRLHAVINKISLCDGGRRVTGGRHRMLGEMAKCASIKILVMAVAKCLNSGNTSHIAKPWRKQRSLPKSSLG
jgi:hypothetical protein